MATIILRHIYKKIGKINILKDVSLEAGDKNVLALTGPHSCGKTMILRLIAGLETPSKGEELFDDKRVNSLSCAKRDAAFIFDDFALYPKMTAYENIAFGLRNKKLSKREIVVIISQIAKDFDIEHCLGKLPQYLNATQKLAVAIARALVKEKKVILFDEPAFLINPQEKIKMRNVLSRYQKERGFTLIYAASDPLEALAWSNNVCLLKDGQVVCNVSSKDAYASPINKFAFDFLQGQAANCFKVGVVKTEEGFYLSDGTFEIALGGDSNAQLTNFIDKQVDLCINSGDIYNKDVSFESPSSNCLKAIVEQIFPQGDKQYIYANTGKNFFTASMSKDSNVAAGKIVEFELNLKRAFLFNPQDGQRIL
ncbi:MAG: ABC transporter ATP-binding protein [Elusimicrobiota bacterium]|jgi:multiple sugar transport system ATP-binding protein|nr:ABC transporter ATP-binding protein [Elusimicrobiota bacterium]